MKTNTKKLLGIAVVIFAILITAFISGCMDGANGTNEEPEIESGNEPVLTSDDTQTEPRSPVNINTASNNSPEDTGVEGYFKGDIDDVRITADSPGGTEFKEYWDTVVLVDDAARQVNTQTEAGGPHHFGSAIYLPSESCEVYVTCGGASFKQDNYFCVEGINVIEIDDEFFDDETAFKTTNPCSGSKYQSGRTAPLMIAKTNLNGGFHTIICQYGAELQYRYLSVAYHCKPKEKGSEK